MALAINILPLTSGDRLTRREFERRYQAMPENFKAELIEGVVYVASPVRYASHGTPHIQLATWLGVYCAATVGVGMADNATVRLDLFNEPQPDLLLRIEPNAGGRSQITPDDYIEGPPELIVEIAASSAAYDLREKKIVYQRSGVREYLIWQIYEQRLDWFYLHEDEYEPLLSGADGITRSHAFPGLHLDVAALLMGDLARVLATLQAGLTTAEHTAFADRIWAAS
ncbi:MAG: Uma2 family endonuclease [Roseiflexaceae bacterium]